MTSWHILIVGINHAPPGGTPLRHAEESAENLFRWMDARLDAKRCKIRLCLRPTLQDAEDALAWLAQATHRVLVWTGHAELLATGAYLVTADTTVLHGARKLPFQTLAQILGTTTANATTAIALDTCYSGQMDPPKLLDGTVPGTTLLLASALPVAYAIEAGIEQGLATVLVETMERCADDAWRRGHRTLELASIWQKAATDLRRNGEPTLRANAQGSGAAPLPLAPRQPDGRGRRMSSLEQALGFATQAFCDYLGLEVVRGVEVIYFLSYDPWDGCLVYDGLVSGGVEQTLLNSIRTSFLYRDRLRSKFQERRGTDKLGPAGQCYQRALEKCKASIGSAKLDTTSVFIGAPWFMGDLNAEPYQNSEFRAYDRLLGLRCCLYLPLVIWSPTEPEQPTGGVIMAASRQPFGLEPLVASGESAVAEARRTTGPERQRADRRVADVIGNALELPRMLDDEGPPRKMDAFLRCIAAVYQERSANRWRIRKAVHPVIPKTVVRLVRDETAKLDQERNNVVDAISSGLDSVDTHGPRLGKLIGELQEHGIDRYLPSGDNGTVDARRELLKAYLAIYLWRELKLRLRDAGTERADRTEAESWLKTNPLRFLNDTTLDVWVNDRAVGHPPAPHRAPDRVAARERDRNYRDPGDIRAFQRDTLNDLIDALRDSDGSVFETLLAFLNQHGPVDKYVRGILGVQAILDEKHQFLDDLAHSVQVYLLGTWLMFTADSSGNQIATDAAERVMKFFQPSRGEPRPEIDHLQARLEQLHGADPDTGLIRRQLASAASMPPDAIDELTLVWGLTASMHDIGHPLQRFERWGRLFFEKYFGPGAGRWAGPSGLAEIFLHPRFPVYKNAIVGLHRDRHIRDWLDSLFCRQLTGGIQHGFAGSLILASELEPDGRYSRDFGRAPLWSRIPRHLERIYGTVGAAQPGFNLEQELVLPAYIAHAVALSHVDFHSQDYAPIGGPDSLELSHHRAEPMNGRANAPGHRGRLYFDDIATSFRIDFDEFPVTWLLAVCNVLAFPTTELEEFCARLGQAGRDPRKPIVQLEPSTGIGASPFFVRYIDPIGERSLKIVLAPWRIYEDLTWASHTTRRIPWKRIQDLLKQWQRTIHAAGAPETNPRMTWVVHGDAAYDEQWRTWNEKGTPQPTNLEHRTGGPNEETRRTRIAWRNLTEDAAEREIQTVTTRFLPDEGRWVQIGGEQTEREHHIRRSTFEIVHMLYLLEKLSAVYGNRRWSLEIEFVNVDKPAGAAEDAIRIGKVWIEPTAQDAWERTYETQRLRLWPAEPSLPPFARTWFERQKPITVLDLGCGDGKNLQWLVQKGHTVIGVDGSRSALQKCERFMADLDPTKWSLLDPMDVQHLPPDHPQLNGLSAAICIDVLGHQTEPERTLHELHRVLRPGGVAFVNFFHIDDDARRVVPPAEMEPLSLHEYYYYPDRRGRPDRKFYFRFYLPGDPEAMVEAAGFRVVGCQTHRWQEPAHPGYRDYPHTHMSWFLQVEKPW